MGRSGKAHCCTQKVAPSSSNNSGGRKQAAAKRSKLRQKYEQATATTTVTAAAKVVPSSASQPSLLTTSTIVAAQLQQLPVQQQNQQQQKQAIPIIAAASNSTITTPAQQIQMQSYADAARKKQYKEPAAVPSQKSVKVVGPQGKTAQDAGYYGYDMQIKVPALQRCMSSDDDDSVSDRNGDAGETTAVNNKETIVQIREFVHENQKNFGGHSVPYYRIAHVLKIQHKTTAPSQQQSQQEQQSKQQQKQQEQQNQDKNYNSPYSQKLVMHYHDSNFLGNREREKKKLNKKKQTIGNIKQQRNKPKEQQVTCDD